MEKWISSAPIPFLSFFLFSFLQHLQEFKVCRRAGPQNYKGDLTDSISSLVAPHYSKHSRILDMASFFQWTFLGGLDLLGTVFQFWLTGSNDIQRTQSRIISTQQEVECQFSGMKLWSNFQAKLEIEVGNSKIQFHDSQTCRQSWFKTSPSSVRICATAFKLLPPHSQPCMIREMFCVKKNNFKNTK